MYSEIIKQNDEIAGWTQTLCLCVTEECFNLPALQFLTHTVEMTITSTPEELLQHTQVLETVQGAFMYDSKVNHAASKTHLLLPPKRVPGCWNAERSTFSILPALNISSKN